MVRVFERTALGTGREFVVVLASVWDSRSRNISVQSLRSSAVFEKQVQCPAPVLSAPHLDLIGGKTSQTWPKLRYWTVTPEVLLDLGIICRTSAKQSCENVFFPSGIILKLAFFFIPTTLFAWSHLEAFGLLPYSCCVVAFRIRICWSNPICQSVVFKRGRCPHNGISTLLCPC